MKISHDEIRHIASLARLEIPEDQFDRLAQEFSEIVDMVSELQQADLAGVELRLTERSNVMRGDEPRPSMTREQLLQNAPRQEAGCIVVPRVIE